ncbi:MAG: 16S rRNA (guanine(527)-N(7))-methyltransferase RsmG [Clostridia bacterium]|nr:16S rRNA (guanine(527)-N(7))-methyltransferase RsmG [Clostridia bacterium]
MDSVVMNVIKDFCDKNSIEMPEETLSGFDLLCKSLLEFNSHTNLTAIRDECGVAVKHFADSLSSLIFNLIPKNSKVIDIGCGAGFPGLPLAHTRRDLSVTFLDSTAKKLKFTEKACRELSIDADFLPVRAEEVAFDKRYREKFDIAVSRAVASLPVLLELSLPFVKVGGTFIAYKATGALDELELSKKAIPALGGKYIETYKVELPKSCDGEELNHSLIVIKKVKNTPTQYPRRYAQMVKKPL